MKVSDIWSRFDRQYIPEPNTGCWLWTGAITRSGYGSFLVKEGEQWRSKLPHRLSYERYVGTINGVIDHKCRVRSCVNPDHLQDVSQQENILLGVGIAALNAGKTHCPKGHPLLGDNLWWTKLGGRMCRECHRLNQIKQNAKRRRL